MGTVIDLNKKPTKKFEMLDSIEEYLSKLFPTIENDYIRCLHSFRLFLLEKNRRYGDSACTPVRIFSKLPASSTICARIDDKLSRIMHSDLLRKNDVADLFGYIILLCDTQGWSTLQLSESFEPTTLNHLVFSNKWEIKNGVQSLTSPATCFLLDTKIAYIEQAGSYTLILLSDMMVEIVRLCGEMGWIDFSDLID